MGLLGWLRGGVRAAVHGTARVESIAPAGEGRFRIVLAATAPGLPTRRLVHEGKPPGRGPPLVGTTLPVTLDRDDPERYRIEWRRPLATSAPHQAEAVAGLEDALAALGAGEGRDARTFTETIVTVNGVRVDPSQAADLGRAIAAQQGGDAEPLRRVVEQLARAASAGEAPRPDAGARLAELEKLRAAGLITAAEYGEKRKRILDEL